MRALLLALAFVSTPAFANDENWIEIDQQSNGSVLYYDSESIRGIGDLKVTIWTKFDHSKNNKVKARQSRDKFRVDCAAETLTLLFSIHYDANNNVIESQNFTGSMQQAKLVVPGTSGDEVYKVACAGI